MKNIIAVILILLGMTTYSSCKKTENPRTIIPLNEGWKFSKGDKPGAEAGDFDDSRWENVTVPHDWAIYGPFDSTIDAQYSEWSKKKDEKTPVRKGRTVALPHIGVGWYRKIVEIPPLTENSHVWIEFDGAMSDAKVYLNGRFVGNRPYGYSSFYFDVTDMILSGGKNVLSVRLENLPLASRWYPGAGLYRNVRLYIINPEHVAHRGTYIITEKAGPDVFNVKIRTEIQNRTNLPAQVTLETSILDPRGKEIAKVSKTDQSGGDWIAHQTVKITKPALWSPGSPVLYKAVSSVYASKKLVDRYETSFGIRYFSFDKDRGFSLNDRKMKIKGVCMHHDLGALGAAINVRAMERQLELLKEMGCNAIRTSHNPPAPELLDLCDRMGFLVIDEAFDEWATPKIGNGYSRYFNEWAEEDLVSMIRRDRNHPSVILWSIGNEIREQSQENGAEIARFLRDICVREDPTRPVTAGFDQWQGAIKNGLAAVVDVPGWNYKPLFYKEIRDSFPDWKMIGSETASTVSSRGEYFIPDIVTKHPWHQNYQLSSYDVECASWASLPDTEFASQEDNPFMAGEFVWTGFDYLGEPTPYNEVWPSRSSYFGIIDLCGIPKDRYYLYQSHWSDKKVLHLLPHWNWQGREGDTIPVYCYTNYPSAELLVNGRSLGIRKKDPAELLSRYRLRWNNAVYEPGVLSVRAYNENGEVEETREIFTAENPAKIHLDPDRNKISADGNDLSFVTVSVLDENDHPCPLADNMIRFIVSGPGFLRAVDNGDATSLLSFQGKEMKLFNGKCMAIVQSGKQSGTIIIKVESDHLTSAEIKIQVK